MKLSKAIAIMQEILAERGDVDVVKVSDGDEGVVSDIGRIEFHVAKANEFPKEWNIPEGDTFVRID